MADLDWAPAGGGTFTAGAVFAGMAAIVLATMTESSRTLADTFGSGASVGMSPT
jgi:hypothetical protein